MLQSSLTARYLELVKNIYIEPAEDRVDGNIFHFVMTLPPIVNTPVSIKRKKKAAATNATTNHGTREMFGAGKKKKKKRQNIIVID